MNLALALAASGLRAGVENYSGLICAHCGEVTPMYPAAAPEESVWTFLERIVSVPFSPQAAADADQGRPVMHTRAVPEQVTAFELLARRVRDRLAPPGQPRGAASD